MYKYSSYTAQTPQKHILKSQFPQPVDVDNFLIDIDKFVIDTDRFVIDTDKFIIDVDKFVINVSENNYFPMCHVDTKLIYYVEHR
jgi:hypothetical protein